MAYTKDLLVSLLYHAGGFAGGSAGSYLSQSPWGTALGALGGYATVGTIDALTKKEAYYARACSRIAPTHGRGTHGAFYRHAK